MSINTMAEYDYFNDARRETKVQKLKKEWIRTKEGIEMYSMGRTKLVSLAREAGAVYKIDGTLLINVEKFELFLETFRIPGEVIG